MALSLVFPAVCVHCGREGELFCATCKRDSIRVSGDVCRMCAEPLAKPGTCSQCVRERSKLDRLYASYLYESPIGSAVKSLKFDDIRALGPELAEMFDAEAMRRSNAGFVVPVPMHRSRFRARGYNQSEILGRKLSDRLGVDYLTDVLMRNRLTEPQSLQPTAEARHRAQRGAFSIDQRSTHDVVGKRILLVDDVFTTGSTIKACAEVLKLAGASWVGAAVLTVQPIGGLK